MFKSKLLLWMKKHHFPSEKNPPSTSVSFVAFTFSRLVTFTHFDSVHPQQTWQTTQPHRKATVSPVLLTLSSTTSTGNALLTMHSIKTRLTSATATTTMESTRRCSRTTCAHAATATPFTRTVTCSRTRLSSMLAAEPAFCPCAHFHLSLLTHTSILRLDLQVRRKGWRQARYRC
jgi:hypothetical protein